MNIFLTVLSFILLIAFLFYLIIHIQQYRKEKADLLLQIAELNSRNEQINKELDENLNLLNQSINEVHEYSSKRAKILKDIDALYAEQADIVRKTNDMKQNMVVANEMFLKTLDKKYEEAETEFDTKISELKNNYIIEENKLEDIQKLVEARTAARVREQEIKEKLDFYCLPVSLSDKNDIQTLNRVKAQLNKPRVLSMLIWSTFFQKPMTTLCNNVLGVNTVTGIYKITNQLNDMCYIGQAVDVAKRWKEHAKCGLEIDTPANNKLYKAMIEDGIWNFSWELLETCSEKQLDEREAYYIDSYQSVSFGYNSKAGNKKK